MTVSIGNQRIFSRAAGALVEASAAGVCVRIISYLLVVGVFGPLPLSGRRRRQSLLHLLAPDRFRRRMDSAAGRWQYVNSEAWRLEMGPSQRKMSQGQRWLNEVLANADEQAVSEREWAVIEPAVAMLDFYTAGPSDLVDLVATVKALRKEFYPVAHAQRREVLPQPEPFLPSATSALDGEQWRRFQSQLVGRLFFGYRDKQREVQRLFGLPAPLPLASGADALALERYLAAVADSCPRQGDTLAVATPLGGEIKFYRGYHLPEDIGADHLIKGKDGWTATTCKPLARLREHARQIAHETGCSEGEAVAFLVSDVLPALPLMGMRVERARLAYDDDERPAEFNPELAMKVRRFGRARLAGQRHLDHAYYTIVVFSHLVAPAEVADFYRTVRDHDARRSTYADYPKGREAKPLRPWTLELLRFVGEERQMTVPSRRLMPWRELQLLWNRRYPQKPYHTWQAMRRSYRQATRPREDSWPVPGQIRDIKIWERASLRRRAAAGESRTALARDLGLPLAYLRDVLAEPAEPYAADGCRQNADIELPQGSQP
jgi:hypothetical protein